MENSQKKYRLRPAVLLIPGAIFVTMVVLGFGNPVPFIKVLNNFYIKMMWNLGWVESLLLFAFVVFLIVVLVTPLGKIRLGGPNAQPKIGYRHWFAVSLTTGIGAGVVFWGAAEPLLFSMEPAPGTGIAGGTNEAVIWGMAKTFMHWTITPYASCVVFGLVLAYAIHNMGMPYKVSSMLTPVFGRNFVNTKWASFVDVLTTFALAGAVSGGLGYGIMQLSAGVELWTGIDANMFTYFCVGGALFVVYMLTGLTGLRRGIAWLGDKNTLFYYILLAFIFLVGPIGYTLNLSTQSLGEFVQTFVSSMTFTSPFKDGAYWPQWWDMYWWTDWMAYAPMLGLFFVKMGYGRTLKEFIVVNWAMPSLFGFVWFSVFGGTVLYGQYYKGIDYYAIYKTKGAEALTLSVFQHIPLSGIMTAFMLVIIAVSLITQANSMLGTLSSMSIHDADARSSVEPPSHVKIYWGVLFIAVALVFVSTGGIEGVKVIKAICGMPIAFLGIIMFFGFIKYMKRRPRLADGSYEYEKHVVNAPDNGEEPLVVKQSKLGIWFGGKMHKIGAKLAAAQAVEEDEDDQVS
jgi:Choline-glycine betaine transporter